MTKNLPSSNYPVFKEILLENERETTNFSSSYLKRNIQIPLIEKKAMIFTGIRRSGKSTLMKQIQQELKTTDSESFHALEIHFFDERLSNLQTKDLNSCIEAYYEIHPEISHKDPLYLFFDEIELVPDWELFVDRQLRMGNRKVFITGSSSRLLSREIATSMRGRGLTFEVFPFSFSEILEWENYSRSAIRIDQAKIAGRFQKYLSEGGFPEVIHQPPLIQRKILQEYYEILLLRDILERNNESNIPLVRYFLKILFQSYSSTFTINKCHERLKSLGIKTDKTKISDLLKWVEDCYLFFSISLFTESFSKQMVNPKKVYAIDTGLIKAVATQTFEHEGRLLENVVFIHLRSKGHNIHYYKTASGFEVDFVVDGKKLYQISKDITHPDTYERETRALEEAMSELGIKESYLIIQEPFNQQDPTEIKTSSGTIHILVVTHWLTSGDFA